jgi:hypothetical protein
MTDADLIELTRLGCSEAEIACAMGIPVPALQFQLDHLRDIVPPDVWTDA